MRFSSYITRTDPDRRVILLLDNCSAHGSEESLPPLDNVEGIYLPPNTTSKLQPLDAGIIASVKTRYRRYQYERALDCLDANESNIYKLDQLTAMKAMRRIWDELPASVIEKCWNHTALVSAQVVRDPAEKDMEGVRDALKELVPERARMCLDSILNPAGENEIV